MLRERLLRARRERPAADRVAAARELARHAVELPELAGAGTVAAYVSVGGEPGTRGAAGRAAARAAPGCCCRCCCADNDLDWGRYAGPGALVRRAAGLREPAGPRLGPEAVLDADAVLLPGLAVDGSGRPAGARRRHRTTGCWTGCGGGGESGAGGAAVRGRGGRAGPEGTARPPRARGGHPCRGAPLRGVREQLTRPVRGSGSACRTVAAGRPCRPRTARAAASPVGPQLGLVGVVRVCRRARRRR